MYKLLVIFLSGLFFLPSIGYAALGLDRTRIIYNANDNLVSLVVKNSSESPYLAQAWIEDENLKKINEPLVSLPLLQRIDANSKKIIKISTIGNINKLAQDRETLFYFNLLEIPPKSEKENFLQLTLQSKVKLFYRPKGLKYEGSDEWQKDIKISYNGTKLIFKNPTPYYIVVANLGSSKKESYVNDDFAIDLKPFSQTESDIKRNIPNDFVVSVINDYGSLIRLNYNCNSNVCSLKKG